MIKTIITYIILIIAFLRSSIINTIFPAWIYYGFFSFISILLFISFIIDKQKKLSLPMLIFLSIAFLSLFFNDIQSFFKPWERLGSFIILTTAIGPLLQNKTSSRFKSSLYNHSDLFMIIVTLLSFIFYFISNNIDKSDGFIGITDNSMTLGPIASISVLICISNILASKNKIRKIIYIIILVISFIVVLLAASRGALGSLIISSVLFLIIYFQKSIFKIIGIALISILCLYFTSSLWIKYSEVLIEKHQSRIESDNIFANRQLMILDGIKDFKSSPIFGVGFSSMKNRNNSSLHDAGTFEPPSSWLFLLSTMGLFGFISFCSIIFPYIFRTVLQKNINSVENLKLAIILLFFCIHMLIEGYVLSSGGFLFFYLWLSIGIAQKKTILVLSKEKLLMKNV